MAMIAVGPSAGHQLAELVHKINDIGNRFSSGKVPCSDLGESAKVDDSDGVQVLAAGCISDAVTFVLDSWRFEAYKQISWNRPRNKTNNRA